MSRGRIMVMTFWIFALVPAIAVAETRFEIPSTIRAGEKTVLTVQTEDALPASSFYNVRFECTQKPEGSNIEITPGYPDSDLIFSKAGEYMCEATAGIMTKSSCAGVSFKKLASKEFVISVLQ